MKSNEVRGGGGARSPPPMQSITDDEHDGMNPGMIMNGMKFC